MHTYTEPLPGLLDWSAFLEWVCPTCRFTTKTMGPMEYAIMEGMGLKITQVIGRRLLTPFKHVWAYGWHLCNSWLVQTILMNGLPHFQLPTHPYNVPPVILQWLWKKLLKTKQCKLASRNSYKMLAKRLFQFYSIHIWHGYIPAQGNCKWLEYLQLVFL